MHSWVMFTTLPKEVIVGKEIESEATQPRRVTRLIRLPEVQHRVGLGRSTIYRWMAEGKFPKPVQLGGYSVAWAEDDIDEWIRQRVSDDAI
jgi:prophage regulatory protein